MARKKKMNRSTHKNSELTVSKRNVTKEMERSNSKRSYSELNVFERNNFLKNIIHTSERLKFLEYDEDFWYRGGEDYKATYSGEDWEIDDENWERLLDACGQCVKYCEEHKKEIPKQKSESEAVITKTKTKTQPRTKTATTNTSIDIKKLKQFLTANKTRKVTKTEVRNFCGVSSFSIVKRELEKLPNGAKYLSYIIDMRGRKALTGELFIPGESSDKKTSAGAVKTGKTKKAEEPKVIVEPEITEEAVAETGVVTETTDASRVITEPEVIHTITEPEFTTEDLKTLERQFGDTSSESLEETKTVVQSKTQNGEKTTNNTETECVERKSKMVSDFRKTVSKSCNQKKDGPKNDITQKSPVAKLSELMGNSKVVDKNFIFDESIFKLPMQVYEKMLSEIFSPNINPIIWLFEEQIMYLDCLKTQYGVAQDFLKTFAFDDSNQHTKIQLGNIPKGDDLGKFCKNHDITLVSGKAPSIAWCKVNEAKVIIPNYFRNIHPSPFKGTEIIGVDSCVMGYKYMKDVFLKTKTVWISDIQLRERAFSESEFFTVLAYYGKFGRAEMIASHPDRSIINFFKEKHVDKAYTADYGFKVFARMVDLPVEMVYMSTLMSNNSSSSTMLNTIADKQGKNIEKSVDLKEGDIIKFDSMIELCNGRLRIFKNEADTIDISVYDTHKRKKTSPLRFIEVQTGDILMIRKAKLVLIVEVIKPSEKIGKVIYYGNEKGTPKKMSK